MSDGDSLDESSPSLFRPYIIAGGLTRSTDDDLSIDTVVEIRSVALSARLDFEREAIVNYCAEPQSIAELASRLDLPLSVARVLVSDMTAEGILHRHQAADPFDRAFIEELIEGIRSL